MAPKGYVLNESEARDFNRMRAERQRRGPPKARRQPRRRRHGFKKRRRGDPSYGVPFTIAEYDATTGEVLTTFYRGRRRSTSVTLADTGILVSSDGYLYACGTGYINLDTGVLIKWNIDTGERIWESDANGATGPIFANVNDGTSSNMIVEASDGFIWVVGSDSSNTCIGRFNPTTGVQTHKFSVALATSIATAIYALPADGKILVRYPTAVGGNYAVVLDNTATSVATYAVEVLQRVVVNGSLIYATTASGSNNLRIFSTSLVQQDSRAAPGAEAYGAIDTDGTTVWVTTINGASPMIRAYDATNLATENWNAAQDASMTVPARIKYKNSALYTFSVSVRKHSAVDGSETWQTATSGISPGTVPAGLNRAAVGTSFTISIHPDSQQQIYRVADSDGSVTWFDQTGGTAYACYVTSDDRVFVSSTRRDP